MLIQSSGLVASIAMRAGVVAVVLSMLTTAALLATRADPSPAAPGNKPAVLCWNKDYPEPVGSGDAQVRTKPRKCRWIKRGEASNAAAVQAVSIKWKRWGKRKAKGVGKNCSPMLGRCVKVKVRLTKPKEHCGRRVFSKARFKFGGGTAPDPDFKLYTCAD